MNVSKSKPSILTRRMGTGSWSRFEIQKNLTFSLITNLPVNLFLFLCCEGARWIRGCVLVGEDPLVHQSDGSSEQEDTWPPTHFAILSNWSLSWLQTMHCKPTWFGIQCFVPINSQLSSKLISHPPLTWSQPKLTCKHWSSNQSKTSICNGPAKSSKTNPPVNISARFVKIAKRAPPFAIKLCSTVGQRCKDACACRQF